MINIFLVMMSYDIDYCCDDNNRNMINMGVKRILTIYVMMVTMMMMTIMWIMDYSMVEK